MRGISSIISIVLLLMIVIAFTAAFFIFSSRMFSSTQNQASESINRTAGSMQLCLKFESASANNIYVRNCGPSQIQNNTISVYVDGSSVLYSVPRNINPDEVGTISIVQTLAAGNHDVRISGAGYDITENIIISGRSMDLVSPANGRIYFNTTIPLIFNASAADSCWYSIDGIVTISNCSNQNILSKEYYATTDVAGWWHFNEASGNIAYDSSGNGKNGTLYNFNTNDQVNWTAGRFGDALLFDGVNDYVDMGNSTIFNFTNSSRFSIEVWVKKTGNPASPGIGNVMGIVGKNYKYGIDYSFAQNTIRAGIRNSVNGAQVLSYIVNDSLLNWNHIVFTYEPDNKMGMKLYLNGVIVATGSSIGFADFSAPSVKLVAGSSSSALGGNTMYFNGSIDELRIVNRTLSEEEIMNDYSLSLGNHSMTMYVNDSSGNIVSDSSQFNIMALSFSTQYIWNSISDANLTVSVMHPVTEMTVNIYNSTEKIDSIIIAATDGRAESSSVLSGMDRLNTSNGSSFIVELCGYGSCTNNTVKIYGPRKTFFQWLNETNRMREKLDSSYILYTSNSSSTLAWGEAYLLMGYYTMYEATLDTVWFDRMINHFDYMLNNRRDFYGDGRLVWATTVYSNPRFREIFENETSVFASWQRVNATNNTIYLDSSVKQCGNYSLKLATNTTTNSSQWIYRQIENYTPGTTYDWSGYVRANHTALWIKVMDSTTGEIILNNTINPSTGFTYYNNDERIHLSFMAPKNASHNFTIWFSPLNASCSNAAIWLDGCDTDNLYFFVRRYVEYSTTHNGQILEPITEFIRTVKNNNMTEYQAKADHYLSVIESDFIPKSNSIGMEKEIKEWSCGPGTCAVFVPINPEYQGTVNQTIGLNRMFQYMRVMLNLYNVTGNLSYGKLINETTYWLKNYALEYDNQKDQDTFVYRKCTDQQFDIDTGCSSSFQEDNSHGQLELSYMVDAYRDGIIFNSKDMQRLANTFKKTTWNGLYDSPNLNAYIQGNGVWGTYKWATWGWLHLAEVEFGIFYPIERMYASGGYGDSGSPFYSVAQILLLSDVQPMKLKLGNNKVYGRGYVNSTGTLESDIIALPTKSMLNVTLNSFNTTNGIGQVLVNFTVSSQVSNNPVNFSICSLNPGHYYTINKGYSPLVSLLSNSSGCILFSNSEWNIHEFTIVEN